MTYRPILRFPDPRLFIRSLPVQRVDDTVRRLLDDMQETLLAEGGTSISAVQIGVPLRIVVLWDAQDGLFLEAVNPVLFPAELALSTVSWESCLSFPGSETTLAQVEVHRPSSVRLEGMDRQGETLSGLAVTARLAAALQHEVEHLDGILLTSNLNRRAREAVESRARKWGPMLWERERRRALGVRSENLGATSVRVRR